MSLCRVWVAIRSSGTPASAAAAIFAPRSVTNHQVEPCLPRTDSAVRRRRPQIGGGTHRQMRAAPPCGAGPGPHDSRRPTAPVAHPRKTRTPSAGTPSRSSIDCAHATLADGGPPYRNRGLHVVKLRSFKIHRDGRLPGHRRPPNGFRPASSHRHRRGRRRADRLLTRDASCQSSAIVSPTARRRPSTTQPEFERVPGELGSGGPALEWASPAPALCDQTGGPLRDAPEALHLRDPADAITPALRGGRWAMPRESGP